MESARVSEIRRYLLLYAKARKIRVLEHFSEDPGRRQSYFCHLETPGDPLKTATAISHESADNALVMSMLSYLDSTCNFLDEPL